VGLDAAEHLDAGEPEEFTVGGVQQVFEAAEGQVRRDRVAEGRVVEEVADEGGDLLAGQLVEFGDVGVERGGGPGGGDGDRLFAHGAQVTAAWFRRCYVAVSQCVNLRAVPDRARDQAVRSARNQLSRRPLLRIALR
jgi:hypothetical protein